MANLYTSIRDIWASAASLTALCPASKISVGRAEDPEDFPYVVISTVAEVRIAQTSKAHFFQESILVEYFGETHAASRQIQRLARLVLDADDFLPTLDDGVAVSFDRDDGGREVASGKVNRAFDTYSLIKQQSRTTGVP